MRSIFFLIILAILSIVVPLLSPVAFDAIDLANKNLPPSFTHWFGTDDLGRDLFTRVFMGARISLTIGLAAAFLDVCIGVTYGAVAGYYGGAVDTVMMRFADVLYSIPQLLFVILLMVVLGPGLLTIIAAMVVLGWVGMARIVRAEVKTVRQETYVLAARALGAKTPRILVHHILPNIAPIVIVTATFTIPSAIFTEAFLSYVGLGVPAPHASWGSMASEGLAAMHYYPWRLFFPSLFISLTILAFNTLGDALQDAYDPKRRPR